MVTFYICRHGQTENNKNNRLSGWIDTPLTEEGVKNAASAAAKLQGKHIDNIVSSDLGRAFTTAYIIARVIGYGDEIERLRGLREVSYGELANIPVGDYPKLTPQENAVYVPRGGESLKQMQERVLTCIDNIARAHPDRTILIATHDGPINAVRSAHTGEDIGLVDVAGMNSHDFVGKFTYDNDKIVSFEEVKTI